MKATARVSVMEDGIVSIESSTHQLAMGKPASKPPPPIPQDLPNGVSTNNTGESSRGSDSDSEISTYSHVSIEENPNEENPNEENIQGYQLELENRKRS